MLQQHTSKWTERAEERCQSKLFAGCFPLGLCNHFGFLPFSWHRKCQICGRQGRASQLLAICQSGKLEVRHPDLIFAELATGVDVVMPWLHRLYIYIYAQGVSLK
eukprot:169384-Amphidinium_carterae.1